MTLASEEGLLTISAASNTTDNVRNSKITVETAGDKQEIAVHQAFSWETVLLSTTASEKISLDSEGESVLFTVVSNGQWSVTSDADWVSVESDPVSGTVRVGAPRNPDAHRPGDQRLRYGILQSDRFANLTRGKPLLPNAGILRTSCGKLVLRP